MKKLLLLLLLVCSGVTLFAENSENSVKSFTETFPGKPVITIFSNYHQGVGNASDLSKFEVNRAYLGYKFNNNGEWSGSVIFDIAAANTVGSELQFTSHLKNASLTWRRDRLKIKFGVIKTNNFGTQEKAWGQRYVMKSYMDEYGFAPSADLGVAGSYKLSEWLEADLSFTNGKGNKKLEIDNNYRYGAGFTVKKIKNVTFRLFYDLYSKDVYGVNSANQHTISTFAEYKHSKFSLAGEYNYQFNSDFKKDVDFGGFALYSTAKIVDKLYAFARYDNFNSKSESVDDTGSAIRTGIDYRPFSFLRISPNIYNWNPTTSASQTFIYLNVLINF